MEKKREYIIAFAIITFLAIFFNYRYLNEFPSHMHAWAQSDRYAIALGFVENDLNLFRPQTYVYNKQAPKGFAEAYPNTITAVDFPIHDYVPAILMKITGKEDPWIFRVYTLLYSCIGLWFLYWLARLLTGDFWKSLLVLLFVATSPVFVYYQGGFLPTIPSLANAIIGLFFYVRSIKENRTRDYVFGVLFLTLGTLSRTPFAIVLIAVLGLELLRILRGDVKFRQRIIPVLLSAAAIGGYIYYNGILRNESGSMFINTPGPPATWNEAQEILDLVWKQWVLVYFSLSHYVVLGLATIGAVVYIIVYRRARSRFRWQIQLLLLIWFTGGIMYSVLMLTKFREHDYYFIDALFLPVVFLLILLLAAIPKLPARYHGWVGGGVIITVILLWVPAASHFQAQRHRPNSWDLNYLTIRDYTGADQLLDSLGYDRHAKVTTVFHTSPNMPFLYMKRKGYFVPVDGLYVLRNVFDWEFDCMIIPNRHLVSVYNLYPEIVKRIRKVGGNDRLTVYAPATDVENQTILDLMQIKRRQPVFTRKITFDEEVPDTNWKGIQITEDQPYSGKYAGYVSAEHLWGVAWRSDTLADIFRGRNRSVVVRARIRNQDCDACYMVIHMLVDGKNLFYEASNMVYMAEQRGEWKEVILLGEFPRLKEDSCSFSVYVWNEQLCHLAYDDVRIDIY